MPGKLTTHVLDTAIGKPAPQLQIELWRLDNRLGKRTLVKTLLTNNDGRTDSPLLEGLEMKIGTYEIIFFVGDYFAKNNIKTTNPPFLNRVPIQFSIADANVHYHVPLLTSPWSYSTYRGS